MQPIEIASCPDQHPLCPDQNGEVGTVQPIDITNCPDRPDQFHDILSKKQTISPMIKKSASARLAENLRQRRREVENPSSMFSCAKIISQKSQSLPPTVISEVGTVGTINENSSLTPKLRSGQWSGRSGQWSGQEADAPQSAAATSSHTVVEMQEMPRDADDDAEDWGLVPQSIPQAVLVAGLLAASRIRPRAELLPPVDDEVAAWARGMAQLRRMPPLPGFAAAQWASVSSDCARLLARNGGDLRRLGWSVEDAFGVHPEAPGDAVHCYGLGLLLSGGNVVELTGQAAVIELPNGVRQTFRRSVRAGAVPVWTVQSQSGQTVRQGNNQRDVVRSAAGWA